jgi:hypothetical protein
MSTNKYKTDEGYELLGYKGPALYESGIVYAPYIPIQIMLCKKCGEHTMSVSLEETNMKGWCEPCITHEKRRQRLEEINENK